MGEPTTIKSIDTKGIELGFPSEFIIVRIRAVGIHNTKQRRNFSA
jgi:hypothetical protein